jgi:hypothetical protein
MATRGSSTPAGGSGPSAKRKVGIWVGGVLAGLVIIGSVAGHTTGTTPASDSAAASSSGSGGSVQTTAAPSSAAARAAIVAPTTTVAAPPAPTLAMTCPPAGSQPSAVFGHQLSATAPYTVLITYGDGDRYTNDDQHLDAIFSHTYKAAGSFTVTAALTDATGQSVSATCAYSWAKAAVAPAPRPAPAPAPKPAPAPGPAPAPAPAPAPGPAGGVTGGAFCSTQGATGYTSTGKLMVCTTTATDPRARWRSA